jgi:hypothetical protein
MNFKEVQTVQEIFHKLTENLFHHELQYCEFIFTHLY